jgi:hypothetical protein
MNSYQGLAGLFLTQGSSTQSQAGNEPSLEQFAPDSAAKAVQWLDEWHTSLEKLRAHHLKEDNINSNTKEQTINIPSMSCSSGLRTCSGSSHSKHSTKP